MWKTRILEDETKLKGIMAFFTVLYVQFFMVADDVDFCILLLVVMIPFLMCKHQT